MTTHPTPTPEHAQAIDDFNERRHGRTLDAIGRGRSDRAHAFAKRMADLYGYRVEWADGVPRLVPPQ